jgi:tRNA(Ile)-lysidine synthase
LKILAPESVLRAFLGPKPAPFLVALSGGADSVALLRAAHALAPDALLVLHCDHGLRGAASTADARFAEALCQRLGVSLFHYRAKLGKGASLEERARQWRHACYAHAAQASGAKRILLAHHATDQAETLLLNLVRGAGPQGAAAMQAWSPLPGKAIQLGRPFLGLMPQALRSYLRSLRQTWREDASNGDLRLARNYVRRQVLPLLTELNAKAVEHLAAFCARIQPTEPGLAQALKLDAGARARVLALLAAGQGQTDLGRGWVLAHGGATVDKAWHIELKPGRPNARKLKETRAYWFSPDLLARPIQLRGAKPGERLRPFGFKGSRLVRDLLAEAKVPLSRRSAWPVLASGKSLLAVLGIRRGQGFEAQAGAKALRLTWKAPF